MSIDVERLTLQTDVDSICSKHIHVSNPLDSVVYYQWSVDRTPRSKLPSITRNQQNNRPVFRLLGTKGALLPGESTDITILFVGRKPGIYREKWRLTVDGKQQPYEKSVDLQAIVVQKQDNTALRQQIDSTLDRTTITKFSLRMIDDWIHCVVTGQTPLTQAAAISAAYRVRYQSHVAKDNGRHGDLQSSFIAATASDRHPASFFERITYNVVVKTMENIQSANQLIVNRNSDVSVADKPAVVHRAFEASVRHEMENMLMQLYDLQSDMQKQPQHSS